jgi:choline kinase
MQIILLAAGRGSRIYKKIKINKSLIKVKKKTIINRLIENIPNQKKNRITIVLGFNANLIKKKTKKFNVDYILNRDYQKTEMLQSMYLALKKFNDDFIFSYTDIIYSSSIIKKILKNKPKNICLPININWKKVWNIRKKNIFEDAESLKFKGSKLTEIGNKIKNIKAVQGQFMGIFFIPKNKRKLIIDVIENNNLKKKQITYFMNYLLKKKININIIKYTGHWYEIDDYDDLKEYNKIINND